MALYRKEGWWEKRDDRCRSVPLIRGSHCFLVVRQVNPVVGMGRALGDGIEGY